MRISFFLIFIWCMCRASYVLLGSFAVAVCGYKRGRMGVCIGRVVSECYAPSREHGQRGS